MKLALILLLAGLPLLVFAQAPTQVPVTFTGGHDTDPRDRGRPVVLIAAALNVPAEVFREAFTQVRPAPAGQQPEPDQVVRNKQALMQALGPYGVTDARLNEVSNYYRYSRSRGEMWRNTPAVAYATVQNGVVSGFILTNPGSGYSSPPAISIPGVPGVKAAAVLAFGTNLITNGSIREIRVDTSP
jgi:hypothetical protein